MGGHAKAMAMPEVGVVSEQLIREAGEDGICVTPRS